MIWIPLAARWLYCELFWIENYGMHD